jgi:replicative DNA helicase Mcm
MIEQEQILSVSKAIRLLPEKGDHTDTKKVRGVISSIRPVFRMIAGEYGDCLYCHIFYNKHYEKPLFELPSNTFLRYCEDYENRDHPLAYDDHGKPVYDEIGNQLRSRVRLNIEFEYRNALIIELQDEDKYDDLERLQVILFDNDTLEIRAGELVTVTGQIYIEKLNSSKDSKLSSRMYSHSIKYEARKEITISKLDKEAIHMFVERFGPLTIDKLVKMFAPQVIGYEYVKKGLLLCAASCANDYKSKKNFKRRERMHAILVGEPGLAKSVLAREIVKVVPNSRFESGQSSSGKSLTAIVSKEGGDVTVLRLGPIPFSKEAICAINEIGRMSFDDQGQLLDSMEEGEFTINKYSMSARIRAPTVVIGSANPTTSKWSDLNSDGKINLDDIPAIKPLLDRFDYLFIFKTSRDEKVIKIYTETKTEYEDRVVPNYNDYVIKHILYSKRFNPILSDDAKVILNDYYMNVAKNSGSPRVRETIFNTARMIARLKLKNIVESEDAIEACQFYNIILGEHSRVVNIPANPRDVVLSELLYLLEVEQKPIQFEDLVKKACDRDEYIRTYVGEHNKVRDNKRLRAILDMMLQNSHVVRIKAKPIVLQWVSPKVSEPEQPVCNNKTQCDQCDQCDQQNEPSTTSKTTDSQSTESPMNKEGLVTENITTQVTGSQRAHGSHTDYFELVDKSVLEIPMGLDKDWSIKRVGENGDTWLCDCPGCADNNGGNVITGSVGAIKAHALNHEIIEIRDELERLNDLNSDSLLEELKKYSRDTLQMLQNRVKHGSALERFILEALDNLEK